MNIGLVCRAFVSVTQVKNCNHWNNDTGTWGPHHEATPMPEDEAYGLMESLAPFSIVYTCQFEPLSADDLHDHDQVRGMLNGTIPLAEDHVCDCCGVNSVDEEGWECDDCAGDDYDSEMDTRDYDEEDRMAAWAERYDAYRNEY